MDDVAAEQEDPELERWYGAWDPLLSSDVPALREAVGATEPADHPWRQLLTP